MNEMKQRKKGFLALLLAAVMILGTPGVTTLAADYYIGNTPRNSLLVSNPMISSASRLNVGDTVQTGDRIFYVYNSGENVKSGYIWYDGNSSPNSSTNVVSGSGDTFEVTSIDATGTLYTFAYICVTDSANAPANTSSDDDTPAAKYHRSLGALIRAIKNPGGEIHGYGAGTSLPYAVMKALAENPEDVLVFEADYKGYHYTYTIQGGDYILDMIDPEIPWYGPYWLAQHFFETTTIEKLPC